LVNEKKEINFHKK
jgi:hypothetical protein